MTRRSDDRGVVAVETALVVPLLLALVGGVLLFGLRMWAAATVDHAAQTALREAVLQHRGIVADPLLPYVDGEGYRNEAGVFESVQRRLPGRPAPVRCELSAELEKTPQLPPGADLCVLLTRESATAKVQGQSARVTVIRRVRAVDAAARFLPLVGSGFAAVVGTVDATALGRLE